MWHRQGMSTRLRAAALAWMAAVATATAGSSVTYTQTNVLQNINLQLTIYEQGATNANGRSVADQVFSLTTKSLIEALGIVTTNNFGTGAKLVRSAVYAGVVIPSGPYSTVLLTNLALATNAYLNVGGSRFYGSNSVYSVPEIVVINGNTFIVNGVGTIKSDVVSTVGDDPADISVPINTNIGFITTITPSTNSSGDVTNALIVTQNAPTKSVLTNVSSGIDILYGAANTLYAVDNYVSFSTNSAQIVVETGSGLNTTNALTVTNLASQTGYSIQGLSINYAVPTGSTNLTLTLQGFVKQALKVDILAAKKGTNTAVVEDIFGASSTWNVIGSGYVGGTFTTYPTAVSILGDYLTNARPVVVEGSVNVSFLKNLPQ
jgi:hypothetical protein